jgi:ubiquinol-cytochrome c reductase cytochrome c subunit
MSNGSGEVDRMRRSPGRALPRLLASRATAVALAVGALGVGFGLAVAGPSVGAQSADVALGANLYETHCSACHGVDGTGVDERGPSLEPEGAASVDFVLRTGRMPLADPTMQAERGPVRFDDDEIEALIAYIDTFADGPEIPDVDPARGDVARGGELYRLNCAACHVASGSGAPIGGNRRAPDLMKSTPTEIGEAILIGPGAMPIFGSFSSEDVDDVAAYIVELQREDTTGPSKFGGAGPVAEGLAAWLLALVPLIALTRWIGSPRSGRDRTLDDAGAADAGAADDAAMADAAMADAGMADGREVTT